MLGLKYIHLFEESADLLKLNELKKNFRCVFCYSYKKLDVSGWEERVQKTPIIDLSKNLEEIYAGFRRDTKAGIKKSEDIKGLRLKIPDDDFVASYKFYKKIKLKDGVNPDIKSDFKNCLFFNAYSKGRLFVSMSFYNNGVSLRSKHTVSLRKEMGSDSKVAAWATRRLVWEICKYAKSRGILKLDMGGVNFDDKEKSGLVDFKLSFGGEIKEIYSYRYETAIFGGARRLLKLFRRNVK